MRVGLGAVVQAVESAALHIEGGGVSSLFWTEDPSKCDMNNYFFSSLQNHLKIILNNLILYSCLIYF